MAERNSWNYWATRWMNPASVHRGQRLAINRAVNATRHRPHPWSTFADYPTWKDFPTAPGWLGILPPVPRKSPRIARSKLVAAVFAPPSGRAGFPRIDLSVSAFAQYLTDGSSEQPNDRGGRRRNHEIDLCPALRTQAGAD